MFYLLLFMFLLTYLFCSLDLEKDTLNHGSDSDRIYRSTQCKIAIAIFIADILVFFCFEIQLLNPPMGVPQENIKFGSCTLESDRFISVCETGQNQIAIVDLTTSPVSISRQKMNAEAAIMNPLSKVIALRGDFTYICQHNIC